VGLEQLQTAARWRNAMRIPAHLLHWRMTMDDQTSRHWEVKRTPDSDWSLLPGRFTGREIAAMRAKGDFWIAIPMKEPEAEPIQR
jgi:hypothetical protein